MSNLALLQKRYTSILCANINKKLRENGSEQTVSDLEGVLENLTELTEPITVFGEEHRILPLSTKKLLAFAIDPFVSITTKEVNILNNGELCEATVVVKWSDSPQENGIEGYSCRKYQDILRDQAISAEDRKEKLTSFVIGLATSRALTNAGIGLNLFCDSLDLEIEKVEKEKTEELMKSKAEAKLPDFPSAKEEKASRAASRAAKRAASASSEVEEKSAVTPPTKVDTKEPEQITLFEPESEMNSERSETSSSISLEDALNTVADIGDYAGFTLSDILAKNPRNLIWLTNAGSKVSDAAFVIIDSNEKLKALAGR